MLHSVREEVENVVDSTAGLVPIERRVVLVSFVGHSSESASKRDVQIWNKHWQRCRQLSVENAMHGRASVRFSPSGNLLALGVKSEEPSLRRGVEIYDTTTGQRLQRLKITETGILQFSPVGDRLAVVMPGNVISIWSCETGVKLALTREAGKTGPQCRLLPSAGRHETGFRLIRWRSLAMGRQNGQGVDPTSRIERSIVLSESHSRGEGIDEAGIDYRRLSFERHPGRKRLSLQPGWPENHFEHRSAGYERHKCRIETWDGSPRQKSEISDSFR